MFFFERNYFYSGRTHYINQDTFNSSNNPEKISWFPQKKKKE